MHVLLVLLMLLTTPALAEPPEFWPSPPLSATEARPLSVSSTVLRELAQVDALVAAAAWDEAVDAMVRLVGESGDELVPMYDPSQPDNYFLPLAQACHARMAQWPAEALEVYRGRVDATAESMLSEGRARHDREVLRRVTDTYFVSSSGDDALLALCDMALEAGEHAQARGYLLQISPAIAEVHAGGAYGSHPVPLVYPDTELPIAELLARLAITSVRARGFRQAEAEVAAIQQHFPDAVGVVGGREANIAEVVANTLEAAHSWPAPEPAVRWPTAGGTISRAGVVGSLGDVSRVQWRYKLSAPPVHLARPQGDELVLGAGGVIRRKEQPAPPVVVEPLTDGTRVVFEDDGDWTALSATTGKPLFGDSGHVHQLGAANDPLRQLLTPLPDGNRNRRPVIIGGRRVQVQLQVNQIQVDNGAIVFGGDRILLNDLSPRLAKDASPSTPLAMLDGDLLYAVVTDTSNASPADHRQAPPRRLMAFDLSAEGKLRLEIAPKQGIRISGPPVLADQHVYLPLREEDTSGRISIACYLRASGRELWRTPVASVTGGEQNQAADVLVAGEGMLFINTSAGLIVAVRATDGQVAWARSYERSGSIQPNDLASVRGRYDGVCALAGGALICAPTDASAMFALEPTTGRILWVNPQAFDVTDVLGIAGGRLFVSGRQLWMIDPMTGRTQYVWPDIAIAAIGGSGRGCIAGEEIFWPTQRAIYTFNTTTGQQSRNPIPLETFGETGEVNLVPCGEGLLVATTHHLTLLGPQVAEEVDPSPPEQALSHLRPLMIYD